MRLFCLCVNFSNRSLTVIPPTAVCRGSNDLLQVGSTIRLIRCINSTLGDLDEAQRNITINLFSSFGQIAILERDSNKQRKPTNFHLEEGRPHTHTLDDMNALDKFTNLMKRLRGYVLHDTRLLVKMGYIDELVNYALFPGVSFHDQILASKCFQLYIERLSKVRHYLLEGQGVNLSEFATDEDYISKFNDVLEVFIELYRISFYVTNEFVRPYFVDEAPPPNQQLYEAKLKQMEELRSKISLLNDSWSRQKRLFVDIMGHSDHEDHLFI